MAIKASHNAGAAEIKNALASWNNVATKVRAVYAESEGGAKKVWPIGASFSLEYSGAHTREFITVGGVVRELITITASGILTVTGDVDADVCLVSGGENGEGTYIITSHGGRGGRGGKLINQYGFRLVTGAVQIGAGNGGTTSYASLTASGFGTGAGLPYQGATGPNLGDGIPKRPFGIPLFDPTCGGGGAGRSGVASAGIGNGGTNGGNGTIGQSGGSSAPGTGGARGGGNGGNAPAKGESATFYGSGGGGGGGSSNGGVKPGGDGYQGVMYILLPAA